LPAFAQTSPNQYPFTNEVEGVEFEGADASAFQFAALSGWFVVAPQGMSVGLREAQRPGDTLPPWIFSRPWLKVKRKWDVVVSPWGVSIKIKIKLNFKTLPGFLSSKNVADNVDFWCFGISGADLNAFVYYVTKLKIKGHKIEIEYFLPALTGSGLLLYPIFISCRFPFDILLLGGGLLFPGYYVGPCVYGDNVGTSFLR